MVMGAHAVPVACLEDTTSKTERQAPFGTAITPCQHNAWEVRKASRKV